MEPAPTAISENIPTRPWKRILTAVLAVTTLAIALALYIYYWNPLTGPYQTTFLIYGLIPIMATLFVGLCIWERHSRMMAYNRFLAEQGEQNLTESTGAGRDEPDLEN
jgi:amino acid permease